MDFTSWTNKQQVASWILRVEQAFTTWSKNMILDYRGGSWSRDSEYQSSGLFTMQQSSVSHPITYI